MRSPVCGRKGSLTKRSPLKKANSLALRSATKRNSLSSRDKRTETLTEAVVGAKLHHPKGSETASLNADVPGKSFYLSRYKLNELVFRRLEVREFHLEVLVTSHATTRNQLNAS